jgi:hypothetical protein
MASLSLQISCSASLDATFNTLDGFLLRALSVREFNRLALQLLLPFPTLVLHSCLFFRPSVIHSARRLWNHAHSFCCGERKFLHEILRLILQCLSVGFCILLFNETCLHRNLLFRAIKLSPLREHKHTLRRSSYSSFLC